MWIFLNNSYLSIVQHRDDLDLDLLLVRARHKGDIENVFPYAEVTHTPNADYLYRATIFKGQVAEVIAEQISNIDYDNFKNSIKSEPYHHVCFEVWSDMSKYQYMEDRKHG